MDKYTDYIVKQLHSLGNLPKDRKEQLVAKMMANEFNIPPDLALLAIKGAESERAFQNGR